ncbi:MAG: sulfatase [Myxococcota bacterium]
MKRVAAVLLAGLWACGGAGSASRPDHVVLISIDTLRADHLGAYGHSRPTSPHLDRLAQGGAVFENAISPSPWTLPAHASLLTGLTPSGHGVRTPDQRLPDDVALLAESLSRAGFVTGAVVNSRYLGRRFGFDRGFDHFEALPAPAGGAPSRVEEAALRWLERNAGAPRWFLFVHFYDVHSDYGAAPETEAIFVGAGGSVVTGSTQELTAVRRGERALSAADLERLRGLYDAGIRQVDEAVGRLMEGLADRDLLGRTGLVVTSDHGEEFLEHGGVLHGRTHYREVLRVPLIWHGPGVAPGVRIAAPVSLVDVVPTVLAGLGVPLPAALDGVDLGPRLAGRPSGPNSRRFVVAEGDHGNEEPDVLRSIRGPRFALIHDRRTQRAQLYDWTADPGEQRNRSEELPGVRDELARSLERATRDARRPTLGEPLTPEEQAELRALGYLR